MKPLNRILLADDEPDIRTICAMALEKLGGFQVKACASGQEVLDCIEDFGPDLVVLDVRMPGLDGPDTLTRLKRRATTADTPVAFLTAQSQRKDVDRYKGLGAVEVLAKPFDPMTLSDDVQALWDRHVGESARN